MRDFTSIERRKGLATVLIKDRDYKDFNTLLQLVNAYETPMKKKLK